MDFNEITVTHTQAKLADKQDRAQCTQNTPHKLYCNNKFSNHGNMSSIEHFCTNISSLIALMSHKTSLMQMLRNVFLLDI